MEAENLDFLRYSITAFQKLLKSLETTKFFIEDFIDDGPYFFCILNHDGCILKINDCAADILGLNKLSAVGKYISDCQISEESKIFFKEKLSLLTAHDKHDASDAFEYEFVKEEHSVFYNFQLQKIGNSLKLNAELMLLFGSDVTHLKNLMQERLRSQELEYSQKMLENQLITTQNIQKMLIPSPPQGESKNGVDMRVIYRPSEYCSGDFWWAKDDPERLIIILCDVMGHGVASGMLGSFINGYLQSYFEYHNEISPTIITGLSEKIIELTSNGYTSTFSAVQVDRKNITLWNAGGLVPLVINKDQTINRIKMPTGILGIEGTIPQSITLPRTSVGRIIWHTDGFGDFRDHDGKLYSKKKLNQLIESVATVQLDEGLKTIQDAMLEINKEFEFVDDITYMMIDP